MTNGDRLRQMTDEELGEWLCGQKSVECWDCIGSKLCEWHGINGYVKWLKQESKEQDGRIHKI